jgi:DNA repair protein RecO (recombination protein O)
MIEWVDEGIVLAARRHGERDAIVQLLTFEHGRHAGLVHGGAGRAAAPLLQAGNRLECVWRARLAEHLGGWRLEPMRLFAGNLLDDAAKLAAVGSATALVEAAMPERDPHPRLYAALLTLLEHMQAGPDWAADYVRFELVLLAETGFALDLAACAVTGATADLAYVSPRTGRAVSRGGAGELAARLLPLPAFLTGAETSDAAAIADGLRLAGHFLRRQLLDPVDKPLPAPRERLQALLCPPHPDPGP